MSLFPDDPLDDTTTQCEDSHRNILVPQKDEFQDVLTPLPQEETVCH